MDGLSALEDALRRDFSLLQFPTRSWVKPRESRDGRPISNVLIVGAGQGGLALAAGLAREKVDRVVILDQNPLDHAGPWLTFARMHTLRTPKHVTGPDLGLPNLTIQAWYEAQHGSGAWQSMELIPKETWAAYLAWYRQVLELDVRAETRVLKINWSAGENAFEVVARSGGVMQTHLARRVVLSTGIEGSGSWHVPGFIRDALPSHLYAHTRDDIDFAALAGKRVGVLGAGASAFDNASVALEHGAAEVRLFFRRDELVKVNPYRWAEFVGFLKHHGDLSDADRWRFVRQIIRMGQLPPADTYARACRHERFHLQPGSPWQQVESLGNALRVETPRGTFELDFAIVGTGFITDLSTRPELGDIYQHMALWADRYTPPPGEEHADLARHPYLGAGFEFTEKNPGSAPWLRYLYNYTFGCLLSLGFGGASISGMKYSVPRLIAALTRSLFEEDKDHFFASLVNFEQREF
ncbi:MAG: NAD(P)/FAD-dependent oxidoreductase [Proteobacteria bacterium]|nr:NAD(P)/FAD-dependent oxidoreductase [Pseudomonadota bacterium]